MDRASRVSSRDILPEQRESSLHRRGGRTVNGLLISIVLNVILFLLVLFFMEQADQASIQREEMHKP